MFRLSFFGAAAVVLMLLASQAFAANNLTPEQQSAICGAHKTCKVVNVADAAQGPGNMKLTVVEVRFDLAEKPTDAPDEGCIEDVESADGPARDGGQEFWLLAGNAAPKRILALCNDGYGAAGVGEDQIEVTPNMVTWDEDGGSAWRWQVTKQIRLSPLEVVHEFVCTFNTIGPGSGQVTEIDRLALKARSVGYVPGAKFDTDNDGDCPNWPNGPDATLPIGPKLAGGYAVIMPNTARGSDGFGVAYPDGTVLGDCALEMTSDGLHGFLVYGKEAAPADAATIRVIKETESALLIQVYDPTAAAELAAGKAKSWVGQPHIEIWTSEPGDASNTPDDVVPPVILHQIAVGLDDKTYAGVNAPKTLPTVTHWIAKDEKGRDVAVYRVKWDSDEDRPSFGIGVVYSQAKDGKQLRLISNVQIKKNKPLYLPEAWANETEDNGIAGGTCAIGADKILNVAKMP